MIPLLPLETLPGWPEAPEMSNAYLFMLLLGAPLIVCVVVALITWTPTLARRFRGEQEQQDQQIEHTGAEVARRRDSTADTRI